ncbi:sulfurtransferase TusA family protein [Sphingomonas sp. 1P06PA]|uniref:sulfurtransferase TusA family protein n=1 Tax=Sphingomonas sp. 1P06PA TaxID=554121 RepID=UPI0039A6A682
MTIRIDARGMRCPWPALRLARALRDAAPGATALILADDPIAPREIAALAAERGWLLRDAGSEGIEIRVPTAAS